MKLGAAKGPTKNFHAFSRLSRVEVVNQQSCEFGTAPSWSLVTLKSVEGKLVRNRRSHACIYQIGAASERSALADATRIEADNIVVNSKLGAKELATLSEACDDFGCGTSRTTGIVEKSVVRRTIRSEPSYYQLYCIATRLVVIQRNYELATLQFGWIVICVVESLDQRQS